MQSLKHLKNFALETLLNHEFCLQLLGIFQEQTIF